MLDLNLFKSTLIHFSVRGRSRSVGRGRFLTTDRPADFDRPTDRKIDRNVIFSVFFPRSDLKNGSQLSPSFAQIRYIWNSIM